MVSLNIPSSSIRSDLRRTRRAATGGSTAALAAAVAFAAFGASSAMGQLYWDVNGAAAGLGGNGTWNNSGANLVWNDSTGTGTAVSWTSGSDAFFSGSGLATVTLGATVTANSLTFQNTASQAYVISSGGTIILNNGGNATYPGVGQSGTINYSQGPGSGNVTISGVITGNQDINVWKTSTGTFGSAIFLNAVNTFSGNLNLRNNSAGATINQGISRVELQNANALPSGATVNFVDDQTQLQVSVPSVIPTSNVNVPLSNNFVIAPLGGSGTRAFIGANQNDTLILNGVISGGDSTAILGFQRNTGGGPGIIVLNNANTFSGYTLFNTGTATTTLAGSATNTARGWVQWGVDNALPVTTSMTVGQVISGTTFGSGAIDLAGHNQTVMALASGQGTNGLSQGITNSNSANAMSTLTLTGSAIAIYKSTIGTPQVGSNKNPDGSVVPFGANLSLVLSAGHSGVLDLQSQNATNSSDYFGGTHVEGGTLLVNNNNGSGTGTGPVWINSGATFGGGGSANGAVTVTGGSLRPGDIVTNTQTASVANSYTGTMNNAIGTLTLRGGLTVAGPTNTYFDFNGTQRDLIATSGGTGSASVAFSGSPASNVINLNFLGPILNGVFPLFTYTGTQIDSTQNATLVIGANNAGQGTFSIKNNPGEVDLQITGNIDALIWKGAANGSGQWDTSNNNWTASGVVSQYADGKYVFFDDSANGSGTLTVTINNLGAGAMAPLSTAFNNTSTGKTYIINGFAASDGIGGTGTLQKTGNGTVTINATSNSYTGDTTVSGGTLALGAAAKLNGTQNITIGGTAAVPAALTFASGATSSATTINVNANGTLSVAAGTAITPASTLNIGGGTLKVTGSTTITNSPQMNGTTNTLDIGANSVIISGSIGGSTNNGRDNTINMVGGGTLTLSTPSLYWGGWNFTSGTVIVNSVSGPGGWTGLGPGSNSNFNVNSVHVTAATLQLSNVDTGDISTPNNSPEVFLGNGAVLRGTGSSSIAREDFDVLLDTSAANKSITFNTPAGGDKLTIKGEITSTDVANNFGGFGGGLSGTTVHKTGSGAVVLSSGLPTSVSSTILPANTVRAPAVTWQIDGGMLQLGPVVANPNPTASYRGPYGEPLNGLGYQALDGTTLASAQTGDPEKPSPVFVNAGGTLALAVDAANANPNKLNGNEPPNSTPNYLRAPVTLNGGALAATGNEVTYDANSGNDNPEGVANANLVVAHFGGDFTVSSAAGSQILTFNPANPTEGRTVQLVAGTRLLANATPFYAANTTVVFGTNWNGNLEINPGTSTGGSFDIIRDGGTVSVTAGATITVDQNATLNLGGNLDSLNGGANKVNIVNNSTNSLNVNLGTKNIGNLSGTGTNKIANGATLVVNGTSNTTAGIVQGSGTLVKNGSTTLRVTSLGTSASPLGGLTINDGHIEVGDVTASGQLTANTSTMSAVPVIGATAQLDLGDHAFIVGYAAGDTTHSVRQAIRNLLSNGRNAGPASAAPWNGNGGITSTYAHNVGNGFNLAIGYADNTDLAAVRASGSYTTFGGQNVASNTVLVQLTRGADATMDGVVDGQDVAIIGTHFQKPGSGQWCFGDFDYSGTCDGSDVSVLGTTFGKTSPILSPAQMTAEFGSAFTAAFEAGQTGAVPEPASLTLLGLGGLALMGRRSRKQRPMA